MKLCFICDTIKPGHGGVGDYTRILAEECAAIGVEVAILSLREQSDDEVTFPYPVCRLKDREDWAQKAVEARAWLEALNPDVISLQFVPYAYDPRGLPFGFAEWVNQVKGKTKLHIMFHELWIAAESGASLKNKLIGMFQKRLIKDMLRRLKPCKLHTSNSVYQTLLIDIGHEAELLPLFSNIRPVENWLDPYTILEEANMAISQAERGNWLIAALFGTIHPNWDPDFAIESFLDAAKESKKKPALFFLGRNGDFGQQLAESLRINEPDLFIYSSGELPQETISGLLSIADLGLSPSPWALAGKSGSVLAMLAHGLPVIFTKDDWRLAKGETPLAPMIAGCYLANRNLAEAIAKGFPRTIQVTAASDVAHNLYHSINTK